MFARKLCSAGIKNEIHTGQKLELPGVTYLGNSCFQTFPEQDRAKCPAIQDI